MTDQVKGRAPLLQVTWGATAILWLILLAGCHYYRVQVDLAPDGGGSRSADLGLDTRTDTDEAALREVFVVGDGGWKAAGGSPDTLRFRRARKVRVLADWPQMGGLLLRGRVPGSGIEVVLRNEISVETGSGPGGRTYQYTERLIWDGPKQVVVEFYAAAVERALKGAHPGLDPVTLAELRGLAAGHVAMAWDLSDTEDDYKAMQEVLLGSLSAAAAERLHRARLASGTAANRALIEEALAQAGRDLDKMIEQDMPGMNSAIWTDYRLSLRMPGAIVESNAKETRGATALWELDFGKPLYKPVELRARSVLAD